ncbi:MAG TPA: M2 family metallopeptidase, partial [Chthoniobacterales bacterium]|nr:M2 family metallopeptidase [Chthoniobacterales bacterium]
KGGTEDWRKVLKEATGEDLSTRAMVDYFQPLMAWLEEQNKGRKIGWDEDKQSDHEDKEREEGRKEKD